MPISDRGRKIFEAAKKLAAKRRARDEESQPPQSSPAIETPPDTEQLLQLEQLAIADIVDDAVALLSAPPSQAARTALRERAEKLSLSGRITARVLTKARMDTKNSTSPETRADSRLSRP